MSLLVIESLCVSLHSKMTTQNYIHATVLAIVLATIISEGTSIICYECNSISNPDCANNVENIKPIDCSNKTNSFPINHEINNYQQRVSENTYSACIKVVAQSQFFLGKANSTGTAVGRACINNKTVGLVICNTLKSNESVTSCDVCTDNEYQQ
ncbi:hypothetical protein HCN44_005147 [Aphidius gifuensis]|uniref:Protein quiver n=1 Tax=Aphidius gifuensis TaxID=684658 RepID=A0A834XST5_APHGI|nr:uncharacterized protein LOC122852401 [Aphidius gifuensis]KAF7992803.1 hypothetical protein HCN44_005147 [Aphidius gifuensis]